ncbi:MAG: bifunctional homocysteine S-methyltransferase/methylenetetrahydrofolate reductase [Chloroflexi bacterium]|nr:bifunctional homocysteine S-methyltransferase/methylenetetrahydrofolate reductase [Chloroflexota bacterium]MDL1885285.1 bifunctional homocysteine S-methyltransferase/methylenetetrahydrofolate reductase [Anaerolineae bacterium CFX8]
MATIPFLERLKHEKPLLADGAMGTMLHQGGVSFSACFDELNLSHPEQVARVHRAYIEAGAELIETNTFGANRYKLAKHGLEDQVAEINRAGVTLARRVIDASFRDDVYLAGSVGPLGVRLKPFGRIQPEAARAAFAEQIGALAAAGVDLILLETFSDRLELLEAIAATREAAPGVPVVAQMTFAQDDRTLLGDLPAQVARDLHHAGADVIGVNCGGGPQQLSRILQAMRQAVPEAVFSAMPNAGLPESVGERMMYPATSAYFADYALTFEAIGASVIGGCCGTTPEHIAAMRRALDAPDRPVPHVHILENGGDEHTDVPERPTELARKLAAGRFVVTVEVSPPRSFVPQKLLASAQLLQEAGADMVDVADSPTARMRMSPWAVCHFLQTRLNMETVLHFPTRGRNLLRVQGDLLAAHALGLRNLFVVMGDPTKIGDYPEAMDNYDVAPSALIGVIKHKLNHGVDQAGNSIGQPTTFTVGCALNMGAADIDREIATLRKKLENGADFAIGQVVFDPAVIERFHKRYEEIEGRPLTLPVIMSAIPLYSLKHAQFLHNEVPGISIPEAIMKRIEGAGEDAPAEGVRIAGEVLRGLRGLVQGAYIIPAFGHYELAAEVIDTLGTALQG